LNDDDDDDDDDDNDDDDNDDDDGILTFMILEFRSSSEKWGCQNMHWMLIEET